jgi:hypothetical protein
MIIGAEEASMAGYHQFHAEETQEPYGSFEVFWVNQPVYPDKETEEAGEQLDTGWYWQACFPGCLPDGEPCGPFATSMQAHKDADEWSPKYDE